jgi:hypothetical protein
MPQKTAEPGTRPLKDPRRPACRRMKAATVAASGDHSVVVPDKRAQPWPAAAGSTITRLIAERTRRATARMSATET